MDSGRDFESSRIGGKHSSFEKLAATRNRDSMEEDPTHTEGRDNEAQGTILARPKACRPPIGTTRSRDDYQERSRSSEEDRQESSPTKNPSKHKSAWTRVGRHSEPSSPERESSKPDTSHPEHAKYSQEQEANWRQQSRDRSAAGPVDPQQLGPDGRISWLRQSEQALAQNSDYGNRADAKPRSERGWDPNPVQEREAPPSHRSKGGHAWHGQEKADSDRTQSSRGTTRSGSPPQSYRRPGDRALQYEEVLATRRVQHSRGPPPQQSIDYRAMLERGVNPEKASQGNGSLNILRDAESEDPVALGGRTSNPYLMPQQPSGVPRNPNTQQVYKLLEEVLRGQAPAPASALSMLGTEPPMQPGGPHGMPSGLPPAPYPNLPPQRQAPPYGQNPDMDALTKLASHRWNPNTSMGPENSLMSSSSITNQFLSNIPPNLSNAEHHALLQALQQKQQAHEIEAVANITIQAILSGTASREAAHSLRKRKIGDMYDQANKRHGSLMSEGDLYTTFSTGPQQVCAECGTTNTPTWRRSGKRLMCNACGLRRSRSMRSARSNQNAMAAAHESHQSGPLPNLGGPGGPPPGFHRNDEPRPRQMSVHEGSRMRDADKSRYVE